MRIDQWNHAYVVESETDDGYNVTLVSYREVQFGLPLLLRWSELFVPELKQSVSMNHLPSTIWSLLLIEIYTYCAMNDTSCPAYLHPPLCLYEGESVSVQSGSKYLLGVVAVEGADTMTPIHAIQTARGREKHFLFPDYPENLVVIPARR